jgi:hypothetical protein
MSIVNAIQSDNPISKVLSALSGQSAGDNLTEIASELRVLVLNSAKEGTSVDLVERKTWDIVLRMGRQAIDLFVRGQGNGATTFR